LFVFQSRLLLLQSSLPENKKKIIASEIVYD
jgi:hypothetical protein